MDQNLLRKGAHFHERFQALAALKEPRRLFGSAHGFGRIAAMGMTAEAMFAVAAMEGEADDDMIAGLDVLELARYNWSSASSRFGQQKAR
ncbi:MAG: hypothetical protein ABIS10_09830 [Novosphingobium sp.]